MRQGSPRFLASLVFAAVLVTATSAPALPASPAPSGADHAFANPTGTSYQEKAATKAWQRTLEFFARYLRTS